VAVGRLTTIVELGNTLKQVLSKFDPLIGQVDFVYRPPRVGDVPCSVASCEKSQAILGYYPTHDFIQGLEETCKWYWEQTHPKQE
jgi:UDP-N-acetylglucosamine 4-epimerase